MFRDNLANASAGKLFCGTGASSMKKFDEGFSKISFSTSVDSEKKNYDRSLGKEVILLHCVNAYITITVERSLKHCIGFKIVCFTMYQSVCCKQ
jgi:hypothetical protein